MSKYVRSANEGRLRQGEIISDLIQVQLNPCCIGVEQKPIITEVNHPFAIVISQDCDLETDFGRVVEGQSVGKSLPNILFCEVTTLTILRGIVPQGKDVWKRVIQNKDERYQALEAVPSEFDNAETGTDALGIDFKRYFTIPSVEVYKRIDKNQIRRRCRLTTPYVEQFSARFAAFLGRVALPDDHKISLDSPPVAR